MKTLIAIFIIGITLMANCTVDMKKQYAIDSDSKAITKVALECIKTKGVMAGCVKKEKNIYTLQDNMTCLINDGNEAVGVALYPNGGNDPKGVTMLIEEKDDIDSFPNGFKFVPLHKN